MPVLKRKDQSWSEVAASPAPIQSSRVRLAGGDEAPVASPALELTAQLESALAHEADVGRWPLAVCVPLWFAASGLMWWGIIRGVLALLHH